MSVIGLIGPHACGKSTALRRWKERYGRKLKIWPLDDLRKQYPDNEAKQNLVRKLRNEPVVSVIESARGFAGWLNAFKQTDPVIVITCPEPVGRQWLIERRKGKPLSDYWTEKRLEYECARHLANWASRLSSAHLFCFTENRQDEWTKVDAYFSKLFRKLHNGRALKLSSK